MRPAFATVWLKELRDGLRDRRTALMVVLASLLTGPLTLVLVGVLFLFLTSSSLAVIDVISSLVYAVVMPYAGIAIALLFYDLRRRHQEAPAVSPTAETPSSARQSISSAR